MASHSTTVSKIKGTRIQEAGYYGPTYQAVGVYRGEKKALSDKVGTPLVILSFTADGRQPVEVGIPPDLVKRLAADLGNL